MNYRAFYSLVREYVNGKITRERFVIEWGLAQKGQGILPEADHEKRA